REYEAALQHLVDAERFPQTAAMPASEVFSNEKPAHEEADQDFFGGLELVLDGLAVRAEAGCPSCLFRVPRTSDPDWHTRIARGDECPSRSAQIVPGGFEEGPADADRGARGPNELAWTETALRALSGSRPRLVSQSLRPLQRTRPAAPPMSRRARTASGSAVKCLSACRTKWPAIIHSRMIGRTTGSPHPPARRTVPAKPASVYARVAPTTSRKEATAVPRRNMVAMRRVMISSSVARAVVLCDIVKTPSSGRKRSPSWVRQVPRARS